LNPESHDLIWVMRDGIPLPTPKNGDDFMRKYLASHRIRGEAFLRSVAAAALSIGLVMVPGTAMAKPEKGKVYGAITGGVEFPIGGSVHGGATAPVPNLGPLNPALAGVAADLKVGKRSQRQIYKNPYNFGLELGYGVSETGEVFGSVRRTVSRTGRATVGSAVITTTVAGAPAVGTALPIEGTFGKYKATDVELGYRQYFGGGSIQPYGAARAGIGFVDKINANFNIPAAAIAINNAKFYKSSTIFSGGLDLGVSADVGANAAIQLETGLRYASKLKGDDTSLTGLGLQSINNSGSRLSVPITVKLRVGF
jgi:hypothetical protein